jgi:hypothetical protein
MTLPHKKRMEVVNQKLVDEKKLKKYEIITSTSFGHKLIVYEKNQEEAEKTVSCMGQNEMEKKAEDTWDVDSFPMICGVEEIK